jgi:hypothetical protein
LRQLAVLRGFGAHHQSAAAHFTAEAGQSYYFTVKNTWSREVMIVKMALEPLELPDLLGTAPLS